MSSGTKDFEPMAAESLSGAEVEGFASKFDATALILPGGERRKARRDVADRAFPHLIATVRELQWQLASAIDRMQIEQRLRGEFQAACLASDAALRAGLEDRDQARLAALTEVHEFYEFDAKDEEHFDGWLHERIRECRVRLGISESADAVSTRSGRGDAQKASEK